MFSEETDKSTLNFYNNFLFRKCFFDFFQKMQFDGMEAARKFRDSYPCKDLFPKNASDIFEKMIDFYIELGLVPKNQYDELLQQHEKLQFLNNFLRETFTQLLLKKKEIAKNFFELFI